MKTVVLALCCVLFASQVFGQQATQTHAGRAKIWTGAGLLASGLFVMPVTGPGVTDARFNVPVMGVGLAAAGGSLIYWGIRDKQKARQPNTTIGVTFRRSAGIQVRRSW
jgi:hypothetical protein